MDSGRRILILVIQVGVVFLLPVLAVLALIGYVWRWVVTQIAGFQGGGEWRLVGEDDLIFINDTFTTNPHSPYNTTFVLDGEPDKDRILRDWQDLWELKDDQTGQRIYWKLGVTPRKFCGYWFWEPLPNFEITNQIHFIGPWDPPCDRLAEEILRKKFPQKSAYWELYIAYPYMREKKTLAMFHIGHSYMDGYSFVKMIFRLSGLSRFPPDFPVDRSLRPSYLQLAPNFLTEGLPQICRVKSSHNNVHLFRELKGRRVSGQWACGLTPRISMAQIKHAKRVFHTSANCIILSGVLGGLQAYLVSQGKVAFPSAIKTALPLSRPNHPDNSLSNHWRPIFAEIPFCSTTESRIESMHAKLAELKKSSAPELILMAFKFLSLLPMASYLDEIMSAENLPLTGSIMCSSDNLAPLFGMEVEDFFHFMPINRETASCFAWGCMSANGHIRIALTVEKSYFPTREETDLLTECLYQEFCHIFQLSVDRERRMEE